MADCRQLACFAVRQRAAIFRPLASLLLGFVCALLASAQASDNAVNQVAQRMYCPVCENIPLDECLTAACQEWKEEIRAQLAAGRSEQAIIDSFVARFGDHVVGVPVDPLMRALTIALPLLATALALGIGAVTFRRFAAGKQLPAAAAQRDRSEAAYRQRLEADVRARR
ncbi:MAG: cytochrome c-type biogenesis protein CcmH [Chloroflexi bacterium]|nr:cytochrome c-type biogenesis protein CcmH [Chloroflexota bacterium]MCY4248525.1 cytochrome c-type biogenesis protein CcmH [Chloroflexota bacterium]